MLFKFLKMKTKDESIFEKIVKMPPHIQDVLLEKYFIKGSSAPTGDLPIINDIKVMYDKLMSIEEPFRCILLNPYSGKHILIKLDPTIKDSSESSYMKTNQEKIYKQIYFGSFEIVIKKTNVLDGSFRDEYHNFKNILYHELAHAHFSNILTTFSRTHEINADISSIIYLIQADNLILSETRELIDYVIKMRMKTANLFRYTCQLCNISRAHGTENALILFRSLDQEMLVILKALPATDIIRFVIFWLTSVQSLLKNPYFVDFKNKDLISFLFHNNYNESLMITESKDIGYIRAAHMKKKKSIIKLFEKRFELLPATTEEIEIMKGFYLLNVCVNHEYFNDFMTSHLLVTNFDYLVDNLFNKDDYKYKFFDSLIMYENYKNNIANTTIDIPFGYKRKELNNFIDDYHCKI